MKIYKYPLQLKDHQWVTMPSEAKILCVQNQRETITLWVIVDTDVPTVKDTLIRIIGTGYPTDLNNKWNYIGTVQQENGSLVWHVFQEEI